MDTIGKLRFPCHIIFGDGTEIQLYFINILFYVIFSEAFILNRFMSCSFPFDSDFAILDSETKQKRRIRQRMVMKVRQLANIP